ncbi:MAG: hypothetical protein C0591_11895 [Marinilabiliales bacterium]|nr:MAG: hypothetical protein C0591_11895 [Marinilabiliales bacterium]
MSHTVHTSTTYSDGLCEDGVSKIKDISICTNCSQAFWREDAKLSKELDYEAMEELEGALDMMDLPWRLDDDRQEKKILFYKDLLENDFADNDMKEIYLRTRLWWSINDLVRHLSRWHQARNLKHLRFILKHRKENMKLFKKYEELLKENLNRLIFLYIKKGEVDLLYLADMYREKSDFNKAMEILLKVEQKGGVYNQMKHKIRRKNKRVFQLN